MSVLKSRREQSEMQFFQTAVDVQNELIKFCMEEKNVPKKYRFVYAIPIIAEGQALVDNVVNANTIFVKTNEEVIDRRHYQNEANANCEKILQKLQSLRTVLGIDSGRLKNIVGMVISEKGYITAWKKLFKTKEDAHRAIKALFEIYERMGITVNKKKTCIVALRRGFTFLKTKFTLSDTGKVIMRPCRKSITLERRKLKKLKKKLDEGTITFEEVRQQCQSWKGYMKHKQSWRTVQNMNQLFNELFIDSWKGKEEKKHEDQIQGQQQRIRRIRQENRTEYVACADRNKSKRSEHGRN